MAPFAGPFQAWSNPFLGPFWRAGKKRATAPTLQHIQVTPDGTTFDFIFNRNVTATDATGLTVAASGGAATLTYASGTGTRRLRFTSSRAVTPDEVITVDGDGATTIAAASGGVGLAAFADVPAKTYFAFGMGETLLNPAWNPTVRSIANGAAIADAATVWDTGVAPTAADRVLITHQVTNDGTLEADGILVWTGGKLDVDPAANTELIVTTLVAADDGVIEIGTSGARVAADKTAIVTFRDAEFPAAQLDPMQTHIGLLCIEDSTIRIYGAVMTTEAPDLVLAVVPSATDTTLTLGTAPTGLAAGMRVVIPDTRPFIYGVPDHTEVREIQSVAAEVITLTEALTYDHPGGKDASGTVDVFPHIIVLERNVIFRSENSAGNRGHTLFADRCTVDVEYPFAQHMGRTTNQSPVTDGVPGFGTITDDGVVTNGIGTSGTNQKGRYPFHFHHCIGPANPGNVGYQAHFIGFSVEDGLKWGLAIHRSYYLEIVGGTIYLCNHAGMAFESGNESYCLIDKCSVIQVTNDGTVTVADGMWGLSAGYNTFTGNYVASVAQPNAENVHTYLGHCYHLLDGLRRGGANHNFPTSDDRFPLKRGVDIDDEAAVEGTDYEIILDIRSTTFTDWSDNIAMGSTKGFSKDHWGVGGVTITISNFVTSGLGKEQVFDYGASGATHLINNDPIARNWGEECYSVNTLADGGTHTINRPDFQQFAENAPNSGTTGFQWLGGTGDDVAAVINGPGTIAAHYPITAYFASIVSSDSGPPTETVPNRTTTVNGVTLTPRFGSTTEIRMVWGDQGTPRSPCAWEQVFVFDQDGADAAYQCFWDEQGADEPCAQGTLGGFGATVPGNTNAEEFALSGRASGGEVMPAGATTEAWLSGGKAIAFLTGVVAANGTTVTLTASAAITTDGTGFSVTGSTTGLVALAYVSGSGTKTLVFTAADTLITGETVTGAYAVATGDAETTAAGVVLPDVAFAVTNNSEQAGGGFSPDDIAGLELWIEGDGTLYQDSARTTPASSDTDPVGAWDDASGEANHVLQSTSGFRATLQTNELNGLPVIRFDGADDHLISPSLTAQTVFVVVKVTGNTLVDSVFGKETTDVSIRRDVSSSTQWRGEDGVNTDAGDWVNSGGSFYVDGVETDDAADNVWHQICAISASAITDGMTVGGLLGDGVNRFLACDVAAVLVYSTALGDIDRQSVEDYLAIKWGL